MSELKVTPQSLQLHYPKQVDTYYQRYGHEPVEGDVRLGNPEQGLKYRTPTNEFEVMGKARWRDYNCDVDLDYDKSLTLREDVFSKEREAYDVARFQKIKDTDGLTQKTSTVVDFTKTAPHGYTETIEILDAENGAYSVTRKVGRSSNHDVLSSTVYNPETGVATVTRDLDAIKNHVNEEGKSFIKGEGTVVEEFKVANGSRKFAEGLKGRMQKLAINMERPGLRRVAGFIFEMASKIK